MKGYSRNNLKGIELRNKTLRTDYCSKVDCLPSKLHICVESEADSSLLYAAVFWDTVILISIFIYSCQIVRLTTWTIDKESDDCSTLQKRVLCS